MTTTTTTRNNNARIRAYYLDYEQALDEANAARRDAWDHYQQARSHERGLFRGSKVA